MNVLPPVVIDGSFLGPEIGGIGRYTLELASALRRHPEVSDLSFWTHGGIVHDIAGSPSAPMKGPFRKLRRRWRRHASKRRLDRSLFHGTNYFLPDEIRSGVITVHDLSVFRFPETHPSDRVAEFNRRFRASLDRSSHVITDTEFVRGELLDVFSLDSGQVTAIHLGVGDQFRPRPADEISHDLLQLGLSPGRYALCVAQTEPRKKLLELVTAWASLPHGLGKEFPLVLAGGGGWRNQAIRDVISAGEEAGYVRSLGFLDEMLLGPLYAGARLFVYPSIYEGFGLPPLEAMASGVPVVVADRSCLPEVCGPAANYADPENPEDLRSAIETGLGDETWRGRARREGLARAAAMTWDRCAVETLAVYRRAGLP